MKLLNKENFILIKIIDELLLSQNQNFTDKELFFARNSIYNIFITLNDDKLYKNILYMNKNSKIGKFALLYSKNLIKCIREKNIKELKKLLLECKTIEYDDNKHLKGEDIKRKDREIEEEMLSLIFLIDTLKYKEILPIKMLDSKEYYQCKKDVCILKNNETEETYTIVPKENVFVWVPEHSKKYKINSAYCFKLPEILEILLTTNLNPYTNEEFSKDIKKSILNKYNYESLLVLAYIEVK